MSIQNAQVEFVDLLLNKNTQSDLIYPSHRISIYHHHVMSILVDCLKETYPLIMALLGEEFFEVTAKAYIEKYPSTNPDLHIYGEYFSDFIDSFAAVSHLKYLREVASFEWACQQVYYASLVTTVDTDLLALIEEKDYDRLQLTLNPASAILAFRYPILDIIDLCQGKVATININKDGVNLLILRNENDLSLINLSNADFAFLSALMHDVTITNALDEALMIDPSFSLEHKLVQWVKDKIIVQFNLDDSRFF